MVHGPGQQVTGEQLIALRAELDLRIHELATLGRRFVELQAELERSEAHRERLEGLLVERHAAETLQIGKLMAVIDELARRELLSPVQPPSVEPETASEDNCRRCEDYAREEQAGRSLIADQAAVIHALRKEERRFYASRSWRLTAPFRWARRIVLGEMPRDF